LTPNLTSQVLPNSLKMSSKDSFFTV